MIVPNDLRKALMSLKQMTGVHENYNKMVDLALETSPSSISHSTLRRWLKNWCEQDIPIPFKHTPQYSKKPRELGEIIKSPNSMPIVSIFRKPSITLSIDDGSDIIVDNGKQIIRIGSDNGKLIITQA